MMTKAYRPLAATPGPASTAELVSASVPFGVALLRACFSVSYHASSESAIRKKRFLKAGLSVPAHGGKEGARKG